jgi:hypothetical protein
MIRRQCIGSTASAVLSRLSLSLLLHGVVDRIVAGHARQLVDVLGLCLAAA